MKTFDQLDQYEQAMALRQERTNLLTALALGQVRVADEAAQKDVINAVGLALVNHTPYLAQEYIYNSIPEVVDALVAESVQHYHYAEPGEFVVYDIAGCVPNPLKLN